MVKIWFPIYLILLASISLSAQTKNPFEIISTKTETSNTIQNTESSKLIEQNQGSLELIDSNTISDDILPANNDVSDNPFEILSADELESEPQTTALVDEDIENKGAQIAQEKKAEPDNDSILARKASSTFSNFIFWILMISLFILAIVINLKRKTFMNLYRAITNDNYLKLLQREENNGLSFFFLLLYVIFFLNASLFIYQTKLNEYNIFGLNPYFMVMLCLIGIYAIRYFTMSWLHFIYPLEKEAKQFNFTIIMFNIIIGLLFIPVNVMIAYTGIASIAAWIGFAMIIFFYFLRQLRGLFIAARTRGINYFHFFIYLCAFEVAPLIWIISIANDWSTNS